MSHKTLTYGTLPDIEDFPDEPYPMDLRGEDFKAAAGIINQGIDSHLEAVFTTQDGRKIVIKDAASLHCFVRRCIESDDDAALDLASSILCTLDIEWV